MLTKGAIGNLVNRYKAVLKKCNLINTFGSLAVASMLVLGGAGVAEAFEVVDLSKEDCPQEIIKKTDTSDEHWTGFKAKADATISNLTLIDIESYGSKGFHVLKKNVTRDNKSSDLLINVTSKESSMSGDSVGIFVEGKSQLNINANNLNISSHADNTKESYGITTKGKASMITINANNTYIHVRSNDEGKATALNIINGSELIITGNVTIDAKLGYVLSTNEKAKTVINESGSNVVKLDGNIKFEWGGSNTSTTSDANVQITLATSDSYWTGSPIVAWSSQGNYKPKDSGLEVENMVLNLKNGATWEPIYVKPDLSTSGVKSDYRLTALNNLNLDGGNVNVMGGVNALVENVTTGEKGGNINIADVENPGTFTVDATNTDAEDTTKAALNVQALDAATKTVKNADQVTADRLAVLQQQVKTVETSEDGKEKKEVVLETTASATEGIVNAAFTTDSKGKLISGGGASSVTKAVLEAASVNTVALDKILTNDVRKRLGDIRSDASKTGVWMRWDGGKLKGEGLTNNFNTIQIGGDTKVAKNCRLGVAGSFTHGDTDFARGNGELEGFSFVAYATWMGDNGMFADVVARLGHFSTEINVEGQSGDMDNRVASISGEYGWRLPICNQFFIEPQVELAYTYVSSEDLELETARFSFDNVDSLTGRVGLVAGWNLPDDRGNVYARASMVQQFMGDAKVTGYSGVAPTVHETDGEDTWLEYGIGANVKLTDNTYLWADVERTEGADIDEEWRGTVGIRYSF